MGTATTADFDRDVANTHVKQAEALVYAGLLRLPTWKVRDMRDAHISYDFEVVVCGERRTVDVKYDRYIEMTRNVVFECAHRHDHGLERPGWGYSPHLDYIAVVGERMDRCWMYSVPAFRQLVDTAIRAGEEQRWKRTEPRNRQGYVTVGYAVPQAELNRAGVYRMEFALSGDPLATMRDW